MNLLAFDTSSQVLSVALKKGADSVSGTRLVGFLKHAENLLPLIDRLLQEKSLTFNEVDAFLIGCGPGSFTGLRIGFATLKGLTVLQKKPCFGAFSLDMIAEAVDLPDGSSLAVCLDAHREKIYAKHFIREKQRWIDRSEIQVLTAEDLGRGLGDSVHLCGDAINRYKDSIKKNFRGKNLHFLPEKNWHPQATTLITFFENDRRRLKELRDPADFVPSYFRLSEAEEKKNDHVPSH